MKYNKAISLPFDHTKLDAESLLKKYYFLLSSLNNIYLYHLVDCESSFEKKKYHLSTIDTRHRSEGKSTGCMQSQVLGFTKWPAQNWTTMNQLSAIHCSLPDQKQTNQPQRLGGNQMIDIAEFKHLKERKHSLSFLSAKTFLVA